MDFPKLTQLAKTTVPTSFKIEAPTVQFVLTLDEILTLCAEMQSLPQNDPKQLLNNELIALSSPAGHSAETQAVIADSSYKTAEHFSATGNTELANFYYELAANAGHEGARLKLQHFAAPDLEALKQQSDKRLAELTKELAKFEQERLDFDKKLHGKLQDITAKITAICFAAPKSTTQKQ